MAATAREPRTRDRIAAGLVLALLAVGCLVLWIGIPWGGMWLTGEIADTSASQFLYALLLIPATMFCFALGLTWVNGLYMRMTEAYRNNGEEEPDGWPRVRGPLESFLVASLVVAIIALVVWFFTIAESPGDRGYW